MTLLVRLVHDVQPVVIVQGVHLGIVGIVAGTHRIQVVPLHEQDVLDHRFHRDGLAVDRMDVVPVRTLEVGQYIVDIELVLPEFDFAETVLEEGRFQGTARRVQKFQTDGVEVRFFRRPEFRLRNGKSQGDFRAGSRGNRDLIPFFIVQGSLYRAALSGHGHEDTQMRFRQLVIERRFRPEIGQMGLRPRHQVHVAVDTGEAEHVLILEVRTVTVFVNLDSNGIDALPDVLRDIELGIVVGTLAVTDLLAVHPHVKCGIDAVEMQEDLLSGPVGRQGEFPAVGAHGIGFLLHRVAALGLDEGRIVQERIGAVRIERGAVAFHFPVGRDVDLLPASHAIGLLIEVQRPLFRILDPVELPFPVEEHIPGRCRPLPGAGIGRIGHHFRLGGIGNHRHMTRFLVHGEHALVLPVVSGRSLRDDEIHLRRGFGDIPALERALGIGLELPGGITPPARTAKSQGQAGGDAGKCVRAIPHGIDPPLLVGIHFFFLPLEDRVLIIPAGIVQSHVGITVHELVNPLAQRTDLPHLAGIPGFRFRQDNGGLRLNAALRIQHQAIGRSQCVTLVRVKGLRP